MNEIERNKRLLSLVNEIGGDKSLMELVATMINKDTPSMQKTFELLTKNSPIATFMGVETLNEINKKEE